ncbi:MAG: Maf family nucleotide pyrophosphatase [Candidatus Omnitrophica bacterium]|nr:Maf family nucleotide pyrophosphatase [Candidatus Omnitrophota bacterium]
MREIILASFSERRSKILSNCGIKHKVMPSGAHEKVDKSVSIIELVKMNAAKKAKTIAKKKKKAIIIGADTLVVHDGEFIGKPSDEKAARRMLERFSGDYLEVYTGVCVMCDELGKRAVGYEKSSIRVAGLSKKEVAEYFKLLAPYDKAGGFSIEDIGALIFDNISGSYFNILGLPMMKLRELFAEIGEDILLYVR